MTTTPPLMDSKMYFLSGEDICEKVIFAFALTSSSWGTGRSLHLGERAPLGGGGGIGCPISWPGVWPITRSRTTSVPQLPREHGIVRFILWHCDGQPSQNGFAAYISNALVWMPN